MPQADALPVQLLVGRVSIEDNESKHLPRKCANGFSAVCVAAGFAFALGVILPSFPCCFIPAAFLPSFPRESCSLGRAGPSAKPRRLPQQHRCQHRGSLLLCSHNFLLFSLL